MHIHRQVNGGLSGSVSLEKRAKERERELAKWLSLFLKLNSHRPIETEEEEDGHWPPLFIVQRLYSKDKASLSLSL